MVITQAKVRLLIVTARLPLESIVQFILPYNFVREGPFPPRLLHTGNFQVLLWNKLVPSPLSHTSSSIEAFPWWGGGHEVKSPYSFFGPARRLDAPPSCIGGRAADDNVLSQWRRTQNWGQFSLDCKPQHPSTCPVSSSYGHIFFSSNVINIPEQECELVPGLWEIYRP